MRCGCGLAVRHAEHIETAFEALRAVRAIEAMLFDHFDCGISIVQKIYPSS